MMSNEIAKYRDPEHPDRWWLTDFTMDQVEGHIKNLEARCKELHDEVKNEKRKTEAEIKCRNAVARVLAATEAELNRLREFSSKFCWEEEHNKCADCETLKEENRRIKAELAKYEACDCPHLARCDLCS